MRGVKYSRKIDKLIQKGVPLREIRKRIQQERRSKKFNKKGQLTRVSNIILGGVSAGITIVIWIFASPFIKEIISSVKQDLGAVPSFIMTILPYVILLLLFLGLVQALRGGFSSET